MESGKGLLNQELEDSILLRGQFLVKFRRMPLPSIFL